MIIFSNFQGYNYTFSLIKILNLELLCKVIFSALEEKRSGAYLTLLNFYCVWWNGFSLYMDKNFRFQDTSRLTQMVTFPSNVKIVTTLTLLSSIFKLCLITAKKCITYPFGIFFSAFLICNKGCLYDYCPLQAWLNSCFQHNPVPNFL